MTGYPLVSNSLLTTTATAMAEKNNQTILQSPWTTVFQNITNVHQQRGEDLVSAETYFTFQIICAPVRFVLCSVGIYTNRLCIRTFHRLGLKDSVSLIYFFLAIADFSHLVLAVGLAIVDLIEQLQKPLGFNYEYPSHLVQNFYGLTIRPFNEIIYLTTVFLAVQRCLCVAMPLHFKGIFTRRRTFMIMAVIWVCPFTIFITWLSLHEVKKVYDQPTNSSRYLVLTRRGWGVLEDIVSVSFGILFKVVNQLVVSVCVFVMARALTKSVNFRHTVTTSTNTQESSNRKSEADVTEQQQKESAAIMANTKEKQAITQVTLVSTIFLICNIPQIMVAFTALLVPEFYLFRQYHFMFILVYYIWIIFEIFNSSVNFFVYYKYNTKFRNMCFRSKTQ